MAHTNYLIQCSKNEKVSVELVKLILKNFIGCTCTLYWENQWFHDSRVGNFPQLYIWLSYIIMTFVNNAFGVFVIMTYVQFM